MKLDIKVGEIWETENPNYLKEIIYVNNGYIVAISTDSDRENCVFVYDAFGYPMMKSTTVHKLVRKKPEKKVVELVRYLALFHNKHINETYMSVYSTKDSRAENISNFIKWIEIKELFEVEV